MIPTKSAKFLSVCLLTLFSLTAKADYNFKARCNDDLRDTPQAIGRNAWARRCGIIDRSEETFYNARGKYAVIANFLAPVTEHEACVDGAMLLGLCQVAGCYTPSQRILFEDGYQEIAIAATCEQKEISALSASWSFGDELAWQGEEVDSFVVGEEYGEILEIETENDNHLEVTKNHPMVTAQGDVVPASSLIAEQSELLTRDGPKKVTRIITHPYRGMVWNVQPRTERILGNIHLAQNFLTGSLRYQNEWIDTEERLHLRNTVETSCF